MGARDVPGRLRAASPDAWDASRLEREERVEDDFVLPAQVYPRGGSPRELERHRKLWLTVLEGGVTAFVIGREPWDYFLGRPACEAVCDLAGIDVEWARRRARIKRGAWVARRLLRTAA